MSAATWIVCTLVIAGGMALAAWLGYDSGYGAGWLDHFDSVHPDIAERIAPPFPPEEPTP